MKNFELSFELMSKLLLMHWHQPQSTPCEGLPPSGMELSWQSSQSCGHPCLWILPHHVIFFFFPARFPLICFDTAPTSQSFQHWPSVVCPRHGRLSVSRLPRDCGCMNWTRIRNAPYLYHLNHNLFKLKLKYCCSLRWWISDFHEL